MSHGLRVDPAYRITSDAELDQHYGQPVKAALIKEIDHLSPHYQAFVAKAPFVMVATVGDGGMDCSPRGDPAGCVRVHDEKTLLLPDRRGNNRLDTLRNLVHDPRISLLFLIPGVGETLRINGRASIITEPGIRESFSMQGRVPASVLEVTIDRTYFQCQKALVRSKLWSADAQIERKELPSTGQMLQVLAPDFDGDAYDQNYPQRLKESIY